MFLFVFFKQKTAYEMRISDWSSDVCSSDLLVEFEKISGIGRVPDNEIATSDFGVSDDRGLQRCPVIGVTADGRCEACGRERRRSGCRRLGGGRRGWQLDHRTRFAAVAAPEATLRRKNRYADQRSEEHTSVLQSLMRISYAV